MESNASLALPFLFVTLAALPVFAEESIFDEENPDAVQEDEDGSEEIIHHENDSEDTSETTQNTTPSNAGFLGTYSSQMSFDTSLDGSDEDIFEWSNLLSMSLDYQPSTAWSIVVGGSFEHWTGGKENPDLFNLYINPSDVRTAFDARLGETYAAYKSGDWSFIAGNLITRWGATDITRPGDVINPVDQTQVNGPQALTRIPQPTLELARGFGAVQLQVLLVPFFVADRAFVFGRDTSLLSADTPFPVGFAPLIERLVDASIEEDVQPLLFSTERPEEHPGNISAGARLTATFLNTDVGIGFFAGWDRTPTLTIDDDVRELLSLALADEQVLQDFDFIAFILRTPGATPLFQSITEKAGNGDTLFRSRYERRYTALIEAARYVGPIGVRTDVAFHPEQTYFTEGFRSVRRPTLNAALGLSYERIVSAEDAFTLTVEGFMVRPFDADDGITETFVASAERGSDDDPVLFVDGGTFGVAGAAVWAIPWIKSTAQVGGRSDLTNKDLVLTASFSKRWQTYLETTLGLTVFEGFGDNVSLGSAFDRNDALWVRASGAF